ncbi:MAG TPA: tetratricopeptide repeat protein [Pirellulaceae bacterium]|nr:tetratricopeptide repeat protein [Pirellulaceae bacterium]HMO92510.1 tetratricopeptide repeat protein [Pirellulaceae bacterium]HMP69007.1 tetratricopeptide repeat protein [Pirellulaceae bacterium]
MIVTLLMFAISLVAAHDAQDENDFEAISLLSKQLKQIALSREQAEALESQLKRAVGEMAADPQSIDARIWVARRTAYLCRYREAIAVLDKALNEFGDDAKLLRHRGHRWITLRKFDLAVADLKRAAELIQGTEDEVEPDGQPNAQGIPTSTLHTNIYYHLGLAYYLQGDFEAAAKSYRQCLASSTNTDMRVATIDWLYLTLRRMKREEEAEQLLAEVSDDWEVIENSAYLRRIRMYQGKLLPQDLLPENGRQLSDLDLATYGYGVGCWLWLEGDSEKAEAMWRKVVDGANWAPFGFIAAEAEIARIQRDRSR